LAGKATPLAGEWFNARPPQPKLPPVEATCSQSKSAHIPENASAPADLKKHYAIFVRSGDSAAAERFSRDLIGTQSTSKISLM
jgi:hypothetical protein